ncbi:hypothetical protein, partial [Bacteroides uniformis]|uniref:hypothetical protein n=1 Tax=Bacteroides uniformis TaxID=820 RepID=UPI001EE0D023
LTMLTADNPQTVIIFKVGRSVDYINFVFLEQEANPIGHTLNDAVLKCLNLFKIELGISNLNALIG